MKRTLGEVQADNLDFATHNYTPRRDREEDWCEVSYFLDKDRASGQFSLWRRRDSTPDDEPLSGGSREEIVPGVRGLKFEYYDGFDWYDEWGDPEGRHKGQTSSLDPANLSGMPEAVRITLWLDPGSRPAKEASSEKDSAEPPLVFQTVARLNLAAISQGSASGSTTSGAGQRQCSETKIFGRQPANQTRFGEPSQSKSNNQCMDRRASVLVGLLWCLALLSVVVIGVLHTASMDLRVVKNYGDKIQAHYLALAGIEKAKALLYQDAITRKRSAQNHSGELYDAPEQFRDVRLGRGQFRVFRQGRRDEGSSIIFRRHR